MNDTPITIYGSIISAGAINPDRNLGDLDNSNYPATSVRFYPYLMSLLRQYELSSQLSPYSGLSIIDVQFDYGD